MAENRKIDRTQLGHIQEADSFTTECVFLLDRYPGGHIVLSFLLPLHEQRVTTSPRVQGRVEGMLGVRRPEDFVIPSSNQLLSQRVRQSLKQCVTTNCLWQTQRFGCDNLCGLGCDDLSGFGYDNMSWLRL